jgi:hypothetical protein
VLGLAPAGEVEHQRAGPRSDDHVGQQRVQGVTEPGPGQPALGLGWEVRADEASDRLGGGIQERRLLETLSDMR